MKQPIAIITGAGRGIGRATALELDRRGFAVALVARNEAELAEVARACRKALVIRADVANEQDVDRLVADTLANFGSIDVLINNAGYAPMLSIEKTSADEFRRVIEVNLTSAFMLSRACWPTFVARGGGVIVNVSSMAAKDPLPGFAAYGAAKAGLNTLGLALAREGATSNIRVHTIAPGAVETAMFRSIIDETTWPQSKTLTPPDVANLICDCVTGSLRHTSGETIYVKKDST